MEQDIPVHPCLVEAATTLTLAYCNAKPPVTRHRLRDRKTFLVLDEGQSAARIFKTIYKAIAEAIGERIRPRNISEAVDLAFETTALPGASFSESTQREYAERVSKTKKKKGEERVAILHTTLRPSKRKKLKTKSTPPIPADIKRKALGTRKKKIKGN